MGLNQRREAMRSVAIVILECRLFGSLNAQTCRMHSYRTRSFNQVLHPGGEGVPGCSPSDRESSLQHQYE